MSIILICLSSNWHTPTFYVFRVYVVHTHMYMYCEWVCTDRNIYYRAATASAAYKKWILKVLWLCLLAMTVTTLNFVLYCFDVIKNFKIYYFINTFLIIHLIWLHNGSAGYPHLVQLEQPLEICSTAGCGIPTNFLI